MTLVCKGFYSRGCLLLRDDEVDLVVVHRDAHGEDAGEDAATRFAIDQSLRARNLRSDARRDVFKLSPMRWVLVSNSAPTYLFSTRLFSVLENDNERASTRPVGLRRA